jgi:uncharacterized membrane protein
MAENPTGGWTEQQAEQVIGSLLRAGVILAVLVVLAGGAHFLSQYRDEKPDYRTFSLAKTQGLRTIPGIVGEASSLDSKGIIQLGLVLLIATPVARVAFSVFAFAKLRDRVYVGVTLVVLGVLLYSLFGRHP